jgi:hypothetical protein
VACVNPGDTAKPSESTRAHRRPILETRGPTVRGCWRHGPRGDNTARTRAATWRIVSDFVLGERDAGLGGDAAEEEGRRSGRGVALFRVGLQAVSGCRSAKEREADRLTLMIGPPFI